MPFRYDRPPTQGELRQGEILGPLWEHQSIAPPAERTADEVAAFKQVKHPHVVVLTADCDLLWDFNDRFAEGDPRSTLVPQSESPDSKSILPFVLLADWHFEEDVQERVGNSGVWRQVRNNNHPRYHYFSAAPIGHDPSSEAAAGGEIESGAGAGTSASDEPDTTASNDQPRTHMPGAVIDFKRPLMMTTGIVYEGVRLLHTKRVAWIPPIYLHDLVHRFFAFQSRVSLPDEDE